MVGDRGILTGEATDGAAPTGCGDGRPPSGRNAAHDMFDADEASRGLGIELVSAADGEAVARMRVTRSMLNGHDIAHGGYVFLLADTAFALACNSHGPVTVAAGGDIAFLRPVREGDLLVARAVERTRYGRSGIYDVTVTRGGDEVVAEFRGRSRTLAADNRRA
jgi:acyl-CoA thioesterase